MKRTCCYCHSIYDDKKPPPPNCLGDFLDPKKNHGICPKCTPAAMADAERIGLKIRKGKGN